MKARMLYSLLCFVEPASRHNRAKETNMMHILFLVYFVKLYMFRVYLCPSSGGTEVQPYVYNGTYYSF